MDLKTAVQQLNEAQIKFSQVEQFAETPLTSGAYARYAQAAYDLRHAQRIVDTLEAGDTRQLFTQMATLCDAVGPVPSSHTHPHTNEAVL